MTQRDVKIQEIKIAYKRSLVVPPMPECAEFAAVEKYQLQNNRMGKTEIWKIEFSAAGKADLYSDLLHA